MRGVDIPDPEEDFAADQVELYFDLAYVFAFSQLVAYLHQHHNFEGLYRAFFLFMMMWMPWSQLTWSANAISTNNRRARIFFLVATVACIPMSVSVTTAFNNGGLWFGVSIAVIFLMALQALRSITPDDEMLQSSVREYAITNYGAVAVLALSSIFLTGPARTVGWMVGLAIFAYATLRAGQGKWIVRPGHFAERHGLIVVVALGELIVAIGVPAVEALTEGEPFSAEGIVALVMAGVFAGLIWWAYFDRPARALEHAVEDLPDRRTRALLARDVYSYAHAPIVAGIVFAAAALEEITLHPSEPLGPTYRWMLIAGIAMFLVGIVFAVWRAYGVLASERLVAAATIVALLAADVDVSGIVLLAAVNVVLTAALAVEHVRVESAGVVADAV